ncbi:MAG TPA: AAA family ATPase, partial [Thermoplasmata archaeon]|nr:AAA family ATPase [Thermoplasmata archaeon]
MAGRYRYYKRKLYFSTADRILLHLLEFVGREGEFNQPDDLTQFGIADAIGLGRSTVSKAIRRLFRDKLVRAGRAHVPSGKLRRTVYLLTPEGVAQAGQRKREIEEDVVVFRDPSGAERRLRTGQVPNLLPEYATLLDVATHISEGVFDLSSFRGRRGKRLVDFTERVPRLRYFFGRERELADMDSWLDSPTERVLVISGLTGIGKTTLLARKLEDWREKRHVFFHRIMGWTTLRNVAIQLAEFLNRLSKKELAHYLEATQAVDIEQTVEIVAANLDGVDAVLFYDDYHAAEPAVRDFFYALRATLETTQGAKLVVAGRYVPPFYDRRDVRVKGIVREMPLSGLDPASAEKILENRNLLLPREKVESLLRQTGGHPLFLELADFASGNVVGDIHRYLNEELFSKVTEQEARILTLASVFRYPAP